MRSERMSTRLLLYVGAILLFALGGLGWSWWALPVRASLEVALLAVATVLVSLLSVRLPHGASISVSYPLSTAILILGGPTSVAVVSMLAQLIDDIRDRTQPLKAAFNAAQLVVSCLLAGWVFVMSARSLGIGVASSFLAAGDYPGILLPTVLYAVLFAGINNTLVGVAISISERAVFARVWLQNFARNIPTQLALALLGLALAQAMVMESWLGLLLFAVPLLVSRNVFEGYMRLREAYADTVRGLVAAIEAKDPYTRGHSERVAEYAVRIAAVMRLSSPSVDQLELAALLHDLGKVGIKRRILTKKGRLSESEMEVVRAHPLIAAEIIGSVSFLEGAVPAIVHHHERYDGAGYCRGLKGGEIPLEARILSVADSYDAMTSERPYRDVLSHAEALGELCSQSGLQFDPRVVDAFSSIGEFHSARGDGVEL